MKNNVEFSSLLLPVTTFFSKEFRFSYYLPSSIVAKSVGSGGYSQKIQCWPYYFWLYDLQQSPIPLQASAFFPVKWNNKGTYLIELLWAINR